jgi:hypothetical protein
MRRSINFVLTGLLTGVSFASIASPLAAATIVTIEIRMPAIFAERVAEYVEIHRQATAGIGDPRLCADPEELSRQAADLAAAVRDARPIAVEGYIFTTTVATALRTRIALALRGGAIDLANVEADEEWSQFDMQAQVPWGVARALSMPLLSALPDLPAELEYRLVGRSLVLLDVRANLVVDVLRDAMPAAVNAPTLRHGHPCEVHPDLPACWS